MEQIGRYKILKEVGRGALGVVYAAIDPLIGRKVAVKTIQINASRTGQSRDELRQRLYREAQSAGALSHPAIVTIHDLGEQGDEAYIVMEFIEGTTLDEILSSAARQHASFLLNILKKAADALDYAHARGITHRDIKPSNLMVCADGAVKVTDFGIAKISQSTGLTHTGVVIGTPNYMSPEQAQGRQLDGRSDQFSLAVLAFQMLTRRLPFDGPSLTAVLSKILWEEPDYKGTNLQPEAQAVLQRALSKNPYLRYPSCTDFTHNLEQAWKRQDTEAPAGEPAADAAAAQVPALAQARPPELSPEALTSDVPISGAYPTELTDLSMPATEPIDDPAVRSSEKLSRISRRQAVVSAIVLVVLVVLVGALLISRSNVVTPQPDAGSESAAVSKEAGSASPPAIPQREEPAPKGEPQAMAQARAPVKQQSAIVGQSNANATPARVSAASASKTPAAPSTGTITWSGQLGRNSILVITSDGASYGTAAGRFPGVPIKVEVEPRSIQIRESPGQSNDWSRIMLYTGREKYSLVTIRWTAIK